MPDIAPGPLVVTTRRESAGSPFARVMRRGRARLWSLPTTATEAVPGGALRLERHLRALDSFDWLIFTSARAVDRVCALPSFAALWARGPGIAVVGPATAARVRDLGLPVAVEPARPGAAALAQAILERVPGGGRARALWPRSAASPPTLRRALEAGGVMVVDPVVYATVPASDARLGAFARDLRAGLVDCVCFSSPSAADGLAAGLGRSNLRLLRSTLVASLGATTTTALRALEAPPGIESPRADGASFAQAVIEALAAQRSS